MTPYSPFFLLMGGLVLSLQAPAQTNSSVVGTSAAIVASVAPAPHSSQLPKEEYMTAPGLAASIKTNAPMPAAGSPAAVAASKSQLLVLLEPIQAQQARLDALQAETETAMRRANRAEAATVAFEQRLRQLEAASSRPSFWR